MFLRKKKIKHSSAKDGQEAIEKWRTGGFHLILVSPIGARRTDPRWTSNSQSWMALLPPV